MVMVSAGHVGGTRGSGIVSSAVMDKYGVWDEKSWCSMCLARATWVEMGWEDWAWALPIMWEQGSVSVFWLRWCG